MKCMLIAGLAGLLFCGGAAVAQDTQIVSPDVTYTVQEVFFQDPVTYLDAHGEPQRARSALKFLLQGENFHDGATGPHYFLGEWKADRHYTSPDGRQVAVYFFDPERIPRRGILSVQTRIDRRLELHQVFETESVKWLPEEIRVRHGLPDLSKRIVEAKVE